MLFSCVSALQSGSRFSYLVFPAAAAAALWISMKARPPFAELNLQSHAGIPEEGSLDGTVSCLFWKGRLKMTVQTWKPPVEQETLIPCQRSDILHTL